MTDVTVIDLTSQKIDLTSHKTAVEASELLDEIIAKDSQLAKRFVRWMVLSDEHVRVLLRVGQLYVIGEDNGHFQPFHRSRRDRMDLVERTRAIIETAPEIFSTDHLPKDEETLRRIAELIRTPAPT